MKPDKQPELRLVSIPKEKTLCEHYRKIKDLTDSLDRLTTASQARKRKLRCAPLALQDLLI